MKIIAHWKSGGIQRGVSVEIFDTYGLDRAIAFFLLPEGPKCLLDFYILKYTQNSESCA